MNKGDIFPLPITEITGNEQSYIVNIQAIIIKEINKDTKLQ